MSDTTQTEDVGGFVVTLDPESEEIRKLADHAFVSILTQGEDPHFNITVMQHTLRQLAQRAHEHANRQK